MQCKIILYKLYSLPDDAIHDKAITHQADHEHHGVNCRDKRYDRRHGLSLPGAWGRQIVRVRINRQPCGVNETVFRHHGQALVFLKYFHQIAVHYSLTSLENCVQNRQKCISPTTYFLGGEKLAAQLHRYVIDPFIVLVIIKDCAAHKMKFNYLMH